MKKIKRKVPKPISRIPSFVIGYRGKISPPGFFAAWFDREYGGPLDIRFPQKPHLSEYSAYHTSWGVQVNPKIPSPEVQVWRDRLGWDHQEVAEVFPIAHSNAELHNLILHGARIARGLTLLTEGTSFDMAAQFFANPSDWQDMTLGTFSPSHHVNIHQEEEAGRLRLWTRGLTKFGREEFEHFQPIGLPTRLAEEVLMELVEELVFTKKMIKVGDAISLPYSAQCVRVASHRTDPTVGSKVSFREVVWA